MTSQWVGDVAIDTKQSCDQQPGSVTQYPGKSFTEDSDGKKTWIFWIKQNKTQDKCIIIIIIISFIQTCS